MIRTIRLAFAFASTLAFAQGLLAQRYIEEVFTNDDLVLTTDMIFGTNIDFLTSDFVSNPSAAAANLLELQTLVSTQQPIPAPYFDPANTTTEVKVTNLRMDIYQPDPAVDDVEERPVVLYLHTGNALPPPLNGSPTGTRKDSCAVEVCRRMARRGYVAVSMSYRLGWNPIAPSLQERRGTLLNAIYRALQDVNQCVRTLKADAATTNTYGLDVNKIVLYGEGTGGYIALASATLDKLNTELFIEKFVPDPFQPTISYVDTLKVGNVEGFGGSVSLYRPNGYDSDIQMTVNMGGALADTSWLENGDVPMVSIQTVFDPFAPFTQDVVIVPTTGEEVVEVQGSNRFMQFVNAYGNNAAFASLPDGDVWTDRARELYGSTQSHPGGGGTVVINSDVEGLFPLVTPNWPFLSPGTLEEAGPWQWWDPANPLANVDLDGPGPGTLTSGQAAQASNPNFSATKGRTYLDSIMGYVNPRIVCALALGPCAAQADCNGTVGGTAVPFSPCDDGNQFTYDDAYGSNCECSGIVGIGELEAMAGVTIAPNPMVYDVVIDSKQPMLGYRLWNAQGKLVREVQTTSTRYTLARGDISPGAYQLELRFAQGNGTRRLVVQ
jgi:acetyl esterase/lipase